MPSINNSVNYFQHLQVHVSQPSGNQVTGHSLGEMNTFIIALIGHSMLLNMRLCIKYRLA